VPQFKKYHPNCQQQFATFNRDKDALKALIQYLFQAPHGDRFRIFSTPWPPFHGEGKKAPQRSRIHHPLSITPFPLELQHNIMIDGTAPTLFFLITPKQRLQRLTATKKTSLLRPWYHPPDHKP
jgi:hypothetical protein